MTGARRVQCGAAECKRQYRNERQRAFQLKHRTEHGHSYSRKYDKPRVKRHSIVCTHCGRSAIITKPNGKYCTQRCWYDAKHARHAQVELAWKPTLVAPRVAPVTILRPLRRRWYSGCCPMCATWFVTDSPKHQHCSPRCGRRAHKDKRRAMQREAFVAPVSRMQVYERDRWTCQLCRKPVRRDKVVPHPQAPTLDHVVPLSQGGTHEPANVQLAHYRCNTIKSDGGWVGGEQLALIG
jgi:hypothetical protein